MLFKRFCRCYAVCRPPVFVPVMIVPCVRLGDARAVVCGEPVLCEAGDGRVHTLTQELRVCVPLEISADATAFAACDGAPRMRAEGE